MYIWFLAADIVIKGEIANIPAGKIYLVNAYRWKSFLDSAVYSNGSFTFTIKNSLLSLPGKEYGNTAFVPESGVTTIRGRVESITDNASNNLEIVAGKETEVLFATQFLDFGVLPRPGSGDRKQRLSDFLQVINQYPTSYYLLSTLDQYKRLYSSEELRILLAGFDSSLLHKAPAKRHRSGIRKISFTLKEYNMRKELIFSYCVHRVKIASYIVKLAVE